MITEFFAGKHAFPVTGPDCVVKDVRSLSHQVPVALKLDPF
jgi:hypothetical protein